MENVPDKGAPAKSEVPCDLNSDLAGAALSGTFFRGGKVPDKGAPAKSEVPYVLNSDLAKHFGLGGGTLIWHISHRNKMPNKGAPAKSAQRRSAK